jgi:hypothetical protein
MMNSQISYLIKFAKYKGASIVALSAIIPFLYGCATIKPSDTQTQVKSYIGKKGFPPRKGPAGVSDKSDNELLKKGYMPIGSIKVVQPVYSQKKEDTAAKAQKMASGYGGDLITFSIYNKERVEVKKKRTKCLKKKKQLVTLWDPMEGVDRWQEVEECTEWDYESRKTDVTESSGVIWRLEPNALKERAYVILFKVIEENKPELARSLMETVDINVNTRDRFEWTPLMFASYYGGDKNLELARYLIKKGAYIKAKDSNGKTALMKAVENDNMDIAELLIASGADINTRDEDNKSALDYATEDNRNKLKKWIKSRK